MGFRYRFTNFARKRVLLTLASTLVACIVAPSSHSSSVITGSLGFTSSPRGHVLVPVSIEGSKPLVFVLDTAAAKTFVTPNLADRLGLENVVGEQAPTLGMHGKSENSIVEIPSVTVGEAHVANIQAIVLDLDHITRGVWHVDGVLGMDFLRQFDIRLDFEASLVSFYSAAPDRSSCVACPAGAEGIKFRTIDPGFIVLSATIDEKPVEALLDTGSGHSGLNVSAATALGVNLPPMPAGKPTGHGIGLQTGPVRVGNTTLTEQAMLHVMDHPVMEALGLADRPSMLMGTDQLTERSMTICYGLDTLFLQ